MAKSSRSSCLHPKPALVQEYALMAHIVLEDLIRYGLPSEPDGMIKLACYLDVACILAGDLLNSPPKKLFDAKSRLEQWKRTGTLANDEPDLCILSGGLNCADALWARIPLPALLKALDEAKAEFHGAT